MNPTDRDPADLAAEANLSASLANVPPLVTAAAAPDAQDTRTPDEIRAAHLAEAQAVDAQAPSTGGTFPAIAETDDAPSAFDTLESIARSNPTAIHLSADDWTAVLADQRALEAIEVTSDGATFRGIPVAVEGGIDLPAPEMPAPAVAAQEDDRQDEPGDPAGLH